MVSSPAKKTHNFFPCKRQIKPASIFEHLIDALQHLREPHKTGEDSADVEPPHMRDSDSTLAVCIDEKQDTTRIIQTIWVSCLEVSVVQGHRLVTNWVIAR